MAESVTLLIPTTADYELAAERLQNFKSGLRAGDALPLATAHNQGQWELLSLDKTLVKVANSLGIKASWGQSGGGQAIDGKTTGFLAAPTTASRIGGTWGLASESSVKQFVSHAGPWSHACFGPSRPTVPG